MNKLLRYTNDSHEAGGLNSLNELVIGNIGMKLLLTNVKTCCYCSYLAVRRILLAWSTVMSLM